jgi:hypothetical protein
MDDTRLEQQIKWSKWILLAVIAITVGAYALRFHSRLWSAEPDAWGQFGDYLGGVMNPLIAFGAFYWLATSVALQKAELSATRKALIDTQHAQEKQAEIAVIAAKIQTLNIRLSSVYSQLRSARDRQDMLTVKQATDGAFPTACDPNGEKRFVLQMLRSLKAQISQLEDVERNLIEQVEVLGNIVMPPLSAEE